MKQAITIAKKELRAYFLSPVALIFLTTFLFLVLFSFFWVDTFFRRNIADVRPLFHWLPVLLIFLVSALTMRLWSEEQRMGTLEVLLTLPIKTYRLVLGKFFAGLGLVAVALILTIGLPITVATLGDLDWGPVIGGYLGALLLAAAYLSIGLCISSLTDNPIVALIVSAAICGGFYIVGSEVVVSLAGNRLAEILHAIGTGSRFESIQRGVIDLRDIVYYGSLTVAFLFLNTAILEAKRWSAGQSTRPQRTALKLSVGLVCVNLLVLNVGIASVRTARLDLTERQEYSISPVTKDLVQGLGAPLLIRGYFSAKTHPLLAPLVPRIRDLLAEYSAVGGQGVQTEFIDPQQDPAAEKEANEDYGIKSVPFQFADRHEAAVVNSYFHLLIKYGDQHETLSFQDLIEVNVTGMRDIEVKLRNLEYDLTRAIKKVAYGFKPLEELFARVTEPIKLTAYVTPEALPENLKEIPKHAETVIKELAARANNKLSYETINPAEPKHAALRQELAAKYGIRPMVASLFSGNAFYLHLLLQSGDRTQLLQLAPDMSEADVRTALTASLQRLTPGYLKTIGLVTPPAPTPPPPNPMMGRRPPPPTGPSFQFISNKLEENYTVNQVDLKDGRVPGDVDVLMLLGGQSFDDKQLFAIDQFLMRGGAVVVCADAYMMASAQAGSNGLKVQKVDSSLRELLATWGIKLSAELVLDPQNESFPIPVERNLMGLKVREIRMLNYPFWVDVRPSGMSDDSPIVAGLPAVTMQWVSPIEIEEKEKVSYTPLLQSTEEAWTQSSEDVQPNFAVYPEKGFGRDDKAETKQYTLAVSASGVFDSYFDGKQSPLLKQSDETSGAETTTAQVGGVEASNVITTSRDTARLVVVGTSDFLRDEVLSLSRQTGSDRFTNNLRLAENLLDWSVADVDLLEIRSRGTYARTLAPIDEAARSRWELFNYALVVVALGGIVIATATRRRSRRPIALDHSDRPIHDGGSIS